MFTRQTRYPFGLMPVLCFVLCLSQMVYILVLLNISMSARLKTVTINACNAVCADNLKKVYLF